MKMIRWWGTLAFAVIAGLLLLFNLIFLDGIIKSILEERASLAAGARVDIGNLQFKIFGLSFDIGNLQVANPDQPMRNALEVGSLSFDLAAAPLLQKKIVIERMKVVDLSWNTPRKTSGALPARLQKKLKARKPSSDIRTAAEKRLEDCVLPDFSALNELRKRSPEDLLSGASLQSTAFLANYRNKISQAKESWEKRLATLPTREEIRNNLKAVQNLKDRPPRDLSQIPAYLEKIKSFQEKVVNTREVLTSAQREFQAEMDNLKSSLKEVEKLREQDLKAQIGKLGFQTPSAGDLICVLLGKEIGRKVDQAISWYRKLYRFIPIGKPDTKDEKPEPVPRMKGVDIRFPITRGYPDFLLERAEFSVRPDRQPKPGGFVFAKLAGDLQGVTTNPALYGKPARFKMEGSLVGGTAKAVVISGQLDHRRAPVDDHLNLQIVELKVETQKGEVIEQSSLRLTSALLDVKGNLRIKGEGLNGLLRVEVNHPIVAVGPKAAILEGLFRKTGSFDVTMTVGGTLEQPIMHLSSSATQTLASGLQKVVQSELQGLQKSVKAAISSRIDKDFAASKMEVGTLEKVVREEIVARLGPMGK